MRVAFDNGTTAEVESVEMHRERVDRALPGDVVGFSLKDPAAAAALKRGSVCGDAARDPPSFVKSFDAHVCWRRPGGRFARRPPREPCCVCRV